MDTHMSPQTKNQVLAKLRLRYAHAGPVKFGAGQFSAVENQAAL